MQKKKIKAEIDHLTSKVEKKYGPSAVKQIFQLYGADNINNLSPHSYNDVLCQFEDMLESIE